MTKWLIAFGNVVCLDSSRELNLSLYCWNPFFFIIKTLEKELMKFHLHFYRLCFWELIYFYLCKNWEFFSCFIHWKDNTERSISLKKKGNYSSIVTAVLITLGDIAFQMVKAFNLPLLKMCQTPVQGERDIQHHSSIWNKPFLHLLECPPTKRYQQFTVFPEFISSVSCFHMPHVHQRYPKQKLVWCKARQVFSWCKSEFHL